MATVRFVRRAVCIAATLLWVGAACFAEETSVVADPSSAEPAAVSTETGAPAAAETHEVATGGEAAAPEGAGHQGAVGEEHKSPNLFTVEPGLMIWTIVTFLVVLVILRATAWKPLMTALAEREQKIEGAIAEASRIKNEAEQLFAKYQTMIDRSKDESRAILDEARKDGLALQEDIKNRARQEAEEFKARAAREIELQKDAAVKEIWDQTANLSTMLASKVLGRTLQGADQDRLVRELLAGMQSDGGGASGSRGAGRAS